MNSGLQPHQQVVLGLPPLRSVGERWAFVPRKRLACRSVGLVTYMTVV